MYMHIYVRSSNCLTTVVFNCFRNNSFIRCLLFGKSQNFIPSFFFEFFLKNTWRIFFSFFTFFARLTTTTTPEDEPQPRSIKNIIENNFKVI